MRALNPFTGEFYLETLHVARYTREMYCLFGGRHTHPSTIMPGGCSADITHQTCTDYYVRLMRYFDYVKRSVPMHDDLYDFFLQQLPGYDMVGYRDTNLVNWGSFDDPDYVERAPVHEVRLPVADHVVAGSSVRKKSLRPWCIGALLLHVVEVARRPHVVVRAAGARHRRGVCDARRTGVHSRACSGPRGGSLQGETRP